MKRSLLLLFLLVSLLALSVAAAAGEDPVVSNGDKNNGQLDTRKEIEMRNEVKVEMLGIGACSLELGDQRLLIDAFNEYYTVEAVRSGDILLFTHDDKDHFLAEKVIEHAQGNLIIGPPSIAYPLLSTGKIKPSQLKIMYPPEKDKSMDFVIENIEISTVQTEHFINWNPIHVSYLITMHEKRIFVTGDSYIDHTRPYFYENLDCLIYSLIKEEVVKGRMSKANGALFHLREINDIKSKYNPRLIICNHILNCDWSVGCSIMEECLRKNNVDGVFVPSSGQTLVSI